MKVVIVGAGSEDFGHGTLADLCAEPRLHGRASEIVLVDIDGPRLDRMARAADLLQGHHGSDFRISATTDLRAALPGATYVVTSVARHRQELWEQDYRVAAALGFRQYQAENGGPGSVFHTLRSLHLLVPIARTIAELAPQALVLNYTNPLHRVVHGLHDLAGVHVVGLCHGVFDGFDLACHYLGIEPEDLEYTSAGINHLYAILSTVDQRTGAERLPEILARAQCDEAMPPLFRKVAQVFDTVLFPVDDHTGEYFRWGSEYTDGRLWFGQESHPVGVARHVSRGARAFEAVLSGDPVAYHPSFALSYPDRTESIDLAVPLIADIELDRGTRRLAVNVPNSDGYIDNLPRDLVVEVPAIVDAAGVHPCHVGRVPETLASALRTQATIQSLLTESYRTGSRRLVLQALLLDPCVDSIGAAERLLDTMLELQADFLPQLA